MKKIGKVLVVCAHPDDEILGLGGTLALHINRKEKVFVLIFTDGELARGHSQKEVERRKKEAQKASSILGIHKLEFLNYTDQKLDDVSLLELVKQIELVIRKWKPDIVYTHYWGDLNQDHRKVFEATSVAVRPIPNSKIKQFICFETPSSTEWSIEPNNFNPNLFVNIEKVLNKKIKAIQAYRNEIKDYPHPRSKESIINRTQFWGSSVGIKHAEAFISIREIIM